MPEKGQIYVLMIDDDNGNPQTVVAYNNRIKAKRKEILKWKVFNLAGKKIKVCLRNFRLKSGMQVNPFESPEPFCTGDINDGGKDVITSPKVRDDADLVVYDYDIVVSDVLLDKIINIFKLPFTIQKGRSSVKVDPELELDL